MGPHIRKTHNQPVTAKPLCRACGQPEPSPFEKGLRMKAEEALGGEKKRVQKQFLLTVADNVDIYS